jgi:molybdenum cofactor cytidylyltransferase
MRVAALVMAAGAGSRFGSCKQLVKFDGQPMIRHVLGTLAPIFGKDLFTVLGAERERIKPLIQDLTRVVENSEWIDGLGGSIAHGVKVINKQGKYDAVLIALADQPRLLGSDYEDLLSHFDGSRIVAAEYDSQVGVPAIFPATFFNQLESLQGDKGAKSLILQQGDNVLIRRIDAARYDIDYPQDLH